MGGEESGVAVSNASSGMVLSIGPLSNVEDNSATCVISDGVLMWSNRCSGVFGSVLASDCACGEGALEPDGD